MSERTPPPVSSEPVATELMAEARAENTTCKAVVVKAPKAAMIVGDVLPEPTGSGRRVRAGPSNTHFLLQPELS